MMADIAVGRGLHSGSDALEGYVGVQLGAYGPLSGEFGAELAT
jgi:hypothetical protein